VNQKAIVKVIPRIDLQALTDKLTKKLVSYLLVPINPEFLLGSFEPNIYTFTNKLSSSLSCPFIVCCCSCCEHSNFKFGFSFPRDSLTFMLCCVKNGMSSLYFLKDFLIINLCS
jgi:hypothetical protein